MKVTNYSFSNDHVGRAVWFQAQLGTEGPLAFLP